MRPLVLALAVVGAAAFGLIAQDTIFHSSANVVTVTVSAIDKNGRPVSDLTPGELTLLDDGRVRELASFSQDLDVPLTLGLVVDVSGSQREFIKKHRKDLRQFLRQVIHHGDRAFLISVPSLALLAVDLTDSVPELESAVKELDGQRLRGQIIGGGCPGFSTRVYMGTNCGTLLWNGVWGAARMRLRRIEGRKAILVLSDGQDTGSERTLTSAIEAAQGADAPVYTIGSEPSATVAFFTPALRSRNALGLSYLQHLSDETGGAYFKAARNPEKIFSQIEGELRHLYVLSFSLPEEERDGKFHRLEVQTSRPGVRLRARAGYVAEF